MWRGSLARPCGGTAATEEKERARAKIIEGNIRSVRRRRRERGVKAKPEAKGEGYWILRRRMACQVVRNVKG